MWSDRPCPEWKLTHVSATTKLRLDNKVWKEILDRLVDAGMNMVVIDLGEGMRYKSHPELAVKGSWSVDRLKKELDRIRGLGLEPIPKLNFSTAHDTWLGPYERCVSTPTYYRVCRNLIRETTKIFGRPRFFHLGMDEETAEHQRHYGYAVMRQHELWWHDLNFLVDEVEKQGARPWIWSDYVWHHPETFYKRMRRSVLQSNWHYGRSFAKNDVSAQAYRGLEKHRFDQIPTGSNWGCRENFGRTVSFARKEIAARRLLGFLQTVWRPTIGECLDRHVEAIDLAGAARRKWEKLNR